MMEELHIITLLTVLPLLGAIVVAGVGDHNAKLGRGLALGISLIALALGLVMWANFDAGSGRLQFREEEPWIQFLGVNYRVGVDGLGLLMVLLTLLITPMAMLASWRLTHRAPLYFALMLFLESGLIGTFTALNFFHWFLFWELSLIPAFFLVRLWGGPQRAAAATQFFVYTMVGSVGLLLSFVAMRLAVGTFDFVELANLARAGRLKMLLADQPGWRGAYAQQLTFLIFAGAFIGFAVKVPLMPFHTWLPATYTEAAPGTTMLLTGAMSKMGVYGFVRILLPIFNEQINRVLTPLLWLAVATIVLSAFAAMAQRDLRRILAYSSINHLGYCLLAIFAVARAGGGESETMEKAAALNGVFLQMFNHGLTAAALFWFIALIEQRSGGLRGLDDFGGVRKVAPVLCGLMGIALFSSLGLPGLNGFVGEFLIFKGVFPLAPWAAGVAVLGLLATAIFILTILQRVFNGPLNEKWSGFRDLTTTERLVLVPAMGLMFVLGVYPQLIIGMINSTVMSMVQ